MLRRIFGPQRDEVTGGRRKLRNEELHNLCSSPSVIRMMKSINIRWTGNVARMGEEEWRYDIGKKAIRKETTRKIKPYVGG
jgi:hypothetical protein